VLVLGTGAAVLLAAVLTLNALTFLILGWATWRLARNRRSGVRWYEVTVPLAWLATLGGGVGSNRMLPNYRNIELGLCFVVLALTARYLAGPSVARSRVDRRVLVLGTGAAVLLAVIWFDDPYIQLLVAEPLALAALGWYLIRDRDRRLLIVAAVLLASFFLTVLLGVVAGWFGIEFADVGHTLAISPSALARHQRTRSRTLRRPRPAAR
jgi:hypothetical protein